MLLLEMVTIMQLFEIWTMVTEAEARDPNSVPSQPRHPHRGGGRRRRHQGENIFKPCGQQFRLFFPAQKCFENRCRALRTSSTTTALGAIWGILLGRTSSSWRSTRRASGPTRQRYQLLSTFLATPFTKTILKLSWLSITAVTLSSRPLFSAWSSSHTSWRARLPWRPIPKNWGLLCW